MSQIAQALAQLAEAQRMGSPHARLLALRNAGEALAEALREGPSAAPSTEPGETLVLEREIALPALRLPLTFLSVERRGWRLGDLCIDPSVPGSFARTPFGERFGQRHPLRRRWARTPRPATDARGVRRVVLTTLRYQSLALLLEHFEAATIHVHPAEHARYADPPPQERAAYERAPVLAHPRLALTGAGALAPGVVMVETPGLGGGSMSAVASDRGVLRVLSPHGVALDAWSPYESRLPGLRETLRLRDIEAVTRGDADPVESSISMGLERTLADRRSDHPAFHEITPSLELCPSALSPIAPTLSGR